MIRWKKNHPVSPNTFFRQNIKLVLASILPAIGVTLSCVSVFCQVDTIHSIQFLGNKRSRPDYLTYYLASQPGSTLDSTTLQSDVQRLVNLYGISQVRYSVQKDSAGVQLLFYLQEAITLFPNIDFGGVKGNIWYQLGFHEIHFLGRGMQLTAAYRQTDGRSNVDLFFKAPFIKGSLWGFSTSFFKWASTEPLYFDEGTVFYNYDNTSLSASAIFNPDWNQEWEAGINYFIENYRKNFGKTGELLSDTGPNQLKLPKFLFRLRHSYNRLNYHGARITGWDNRLIGQMVYTIDDKSRFFIATLDHRRFHSLWKNADLATRIHLGLSTNTETPFAPFVLDSRINIRGAGNRVERGTASTVWNVEYRHLLFEKGYFAFQTVLFSDLGSWRSPGGALSDIADTRNWQHFMGGGLRFFYKNAFNAILRVDVGMDVRNTNKRGFVVGFGQFF